MFFYSVHAPTTTFPAGPTARTAAAAPIPTATATGAGVCGIVGITFNPKRVATDGSDAYQTARSRTARRIDLQAKVAEN